MKETLKYKGFCGSIEFSLEDECLVGEVLFVQSKIIYVGETVPELKQAFEDAVESYLLHCQEKAVDPEKPLSGTFNVRISPELHKRLSIQAFEDDCTLNASVSNAIQFYLDHYKLEQERQKLAVDLKATSYELTANMIRINKLYASSQIDSLAMISTTYGGINVPLTPSKH